MTGCPRWLFVAAVVMLAAGGFYALRSSLLPAIARWLDVGERAQTADYVYVLGGDTKFRPQVAADLVQHGLAREILIPSFPPNPDAEGADTLPYHEQLRGRLVQLGVARRDIRILDQQVSSTRDEAAALRGFLASYPDARVTVVTNGYHTRRAQWIFSTVLGPDHGRVAFVSAPADWVDNEHWWRAPGGRQAILSEYGKTVYFVLRSAGASPPLASAIGLLSGASAWFALRTLRGYHRRSPATAIARAPLGGEQMLG